MTYAPTDLTRVKRMNKRAAYDAETVHAILDAQPLCSVAYVFNGKPVVTPTLQWREGGHIYWHGSAASRMLEASEGVDVCVNVTLFDGMVMARSAFNHSCNYRSVMAFGKAFKITDPVEKVARMKAMVEQLFPGRWDQLRALTTKEVKATTVLGLELKDVSAKIRTGPPGDDAEDLGHPVWAGVVPLHMATGVPIPDAHVPEAMKAPTHATDFRIG
jgi:uncharacterized protein